MKIITLAQQKGGVGKTTVCINLACQAVRRKKRAVILEMDTRNGSAFGWGELRKSTKLPPVPVFDVKSVELETALKRLTDAKIDWVFIDLPGGDRPSPGMNVADLTLIPCRPVEDDVRPSLVTAGLLRRGAGNYAYLMNIAPPGGVRAQKVGEYLRENGHPVADVIVTQRIGVSDANARGMGINEREPNSESAEEFSRLFEWVRGQLR